MAAYEPQRLRARNLLLSVNKQNAYGTALPDANLTKRPRIDGGAFATIAKEFFNDGARSGKSHDWATFRKEIARNTSFSGGFDLTAELAGIFAALLFGADAASGAGPYTHLFTWLTSSNIAPVTTLYFEDTADVLYRLLDMAMASFSISISDRGPLQASVSMVGSGRITDGVLGNALPAVPAGTALDYLYCGDTDVQIGASGGGLTSIKDRVRGLQVDYSVAMNVHRGPGGTLYATQTNIGPQRAKISLQIAAKSADDVRTLFINDTIEELKIITNSGASAQLTQRFPNINFEQVQIQAEGVEEVWRVDIGEEAIMKVGATEPVQFTVINSQATYLVGA